MQPVCRDAWTRPQSNHWQRDKEGRPELLIHSGDAAALGLVTGDRAEIGNARGEVVLHARLFDKIRRGVVIAEGIWPNSDHERGEGINVLTGADALGALWGCRRA